MISFIKHLRINWTILSVAWSITILTLSSIPNLDPPEALRFRFWDKCAHAAVYTILGFLILMALVNIRTIRFPKGWSIGIGTVHGILDELHQMLIPGRFCQISDMAADITGILIGTAVAATILNRIKKGSASG